ncbi:MAG TPA: YezD family protein [Gemmataceae bacterium]|nr:YezD family protein [Gemmataceae bacterium]
MADSLVADASRQTVQEPNLRWTWQHVEDALRGLQFGSVTLLVQDGVVVQVERTERKRYQRSSRTPH